MRDELFAAMVLLACSAPLAGQTPDGRALFERHCATCHTSADARVPTVDALRQRTPEAILEALVTGVMRQQGAELADAQRRAVAEYVTGTRLGAGAAPAAGGRCRTVTPFDAAAGASWTGWSPTVTNTRFQPAEQAGLTADQVPKLTLKWALGFPNATSARALPTIAGGRVFVGSQDGTVYSLESRTGCTFWTFQAKGAVRTAIVIGKSGRPAAFFGDSTATMYAVDAATGELLWSQDVEEHPSARVTGTPTLFDDRLYVPLASGEEGQGGNARYECCTFRGSVVALNAQTGERLWKTYVLPPAEPIGKNRSGTTRWGPSGAGIWSSPTVDAKRRLVYVATGNMYTEPPQATSNAVLAFELATGRLAWSAQMTPNDVFVTGCGAKPGPNCPEDLGPDFDFGNSPMLASTAGGRELIVIGQKSGIGWAIDPDKRGAVVWQYRAGRGSALGGMEFGSAVDAEQAYFPVADGNSGQPGGLHAVRLDTGARAWYAAPLEPKCGERSRGCNAALLAAITVIPGVVFAGANDGAIRGYSTKDGAVIWEFDTNREFATVNGVPARGASINGPGPTVAGGMLFINSGYGALGGRPGNVLLAFGVE